MLRKISVKTRHSVEFVDISGDVDSIIKESGIESGICYMFVPHTTAGITINENADPSVLADLRNELNKIVPFNDDYTHLEGNSAAHIKCSLIGVSEMVLIEQGKLALGTWQGVFFCEFDGPRTRNVFIKIM